MTEGAPHIRVVCGNKKCRDLNISPVLEIDFVHNQIFYACPKCGEESKISLDREDKPFPKTRTAR